MSDFLFDDFQDVSEKQWKQKIQYDLNGLDYNKTLFTHTSEGISIKPFYHKDSYKQINYPHQKTAFKICQSIFISNEKTANYIAINALKKGVNSILFIAKEPFDISLLFKGIKTGTEIQFDLQFLSESFVKDLISHSHDCTLFLNIDPIGQLAKTGNWFFSLQKDFEIFNKLTTELISRTTITSINANQYQNAGATIVQQVAYTLAHGFEYLNQFNNLAKSKASEQSLPITANFSVGSNYFFEIAKIRAFRYLWQILTSEFHIKSDLHITATPTKRNKTLYDFNTNMLRTTSECMSAILGGADTIYNQSYDAVYHKKNEFGERISRNQLLILKEESHFKKASEFVDGSYYIESLTKEIAEKALALFKNIEQNGGFLKQLKQGIIQRKIKESADNEQQLFNAGKLVLLGTNKHSNMNDKMKDDIEVYPFIKTKPRKTLIQPIISKRLSEEMEQERLKNET